MKPTLLTLIIVTSLMARLGQPLIGYDCGGSTLNITTFSLNGVGECDVPLLEPKPTPTYIQLLQLSEFDSTNVIQCSIQIDRTITHCGMHSHGSTVRGGRQVYLHDLDERACRRLQETGMIRLSFTAELLGLRRNETTYRTVTMGGSVDADGNCEGAQYSDAYGNWNKVFVTASVKVALYNYHAIVNLAQGKIILPSGTQCTLADETCIDVHGNSAFWTAAPADSCGLSRYDVLYEGIATKLESTDNETQSPDIYTLNTQSTTFALAKQAKYPLSMCGFTLIRTEHPKLFILETAKGQSPLTQNKVSVNNLDIFTYINSKFVYVEKHVRGQIKTLYHDVLIQRCRLERQVLQNALSTAAILPEKFAYTVMKGPGYMAVIAGEVAHIIKCIPIKCKLRRTDACYHEIPVTYRNESLFLSTTSRMLLKSATQTECNPLLPTQYFIEEAWYRLYPQPIEVLPPQQLKPMSKPTWKYVTPGDLASSGIYSASDIEKLRDRIMFPAEKPALLNHLARGSAGYQVPAGSISLQGLLDENTLNHIADNATRRIWNGFLQFGTASAGVIGIFLVIRIIKLVIDTCIHGYALHSLYGWSLYLLGALWSSITGLLVTLAHKREFNRQTTQATEQPLEAVVTSSTYPVLPQQEPARILSTAPSTYPVLPQQEPARLAGVDPELTDRLFACRT